MATQAVALDLATYTPTNAYEANNFLVDLVAPETFAEWKRGDTIDFAIAYYDEGGRFEVMRPVDLSVDIPFWNTTGDDDISVQIAISSQAPSWATHYQILRTKGLYYRSYTQFAANEVKYVRRWQSDSATPDQVPYGSGQETEIYINLAGLLLAQDFDSGSRLGYEFVEGDRLRLIMDESGTYYGSLIDVPIIAQRDQDIVIKASSSIPELKAGVLIEVYTPAKVEEQPFFYETSVYGLISNRNHLANNQNQIFPGTEAIWNITSGNTWLRNRRVYADNGAFAKNRLIESQRVADNKEATSENIGRASLYSPDQRQFSRKGLIRFSQIYRTDGTNGLSSFWAADGSDLPSSYGWVNQLVWVRNVLLALSESQTISIYLGERQITEAAGSSLISLSGDVIGSWQTLVGDHGTKHPNSVVVHKGDVFWYDWLKKAVVRYSYNGAHQISEYNMRRYFLDAVVAESDQVVAGFDPEFREYILQLPTEAIGFSEIRNKWVTYYDMRVEMLGHASIDSLIVFDGGRPSQFRGGADHSKLFGSQVDSEVEVIFQGEDPTSMKHFYAIGIESLIGSGTTPITISDEQTWHGEVQILSDDNIIITYPVVATDFELVNGTYWADLKLAEDNGRQIKGFWLKARLKTKSLFKVEAFAFNVVYAETPNT